MIQEIDHSNFVNHHEIITTFIGSSVAYQTGTDRGFERPYHFSQ